MTLESDNSGFAQRVGIGRVRETDEMRVARHFGAGFKLEFANKSVKATTGTEPLAVASGLRTQSTLRKQSFPGNLGALSTDRLVESLTRLLPQAVL